MAREGGEAWEYCIKGVKGEYLKELYGQQHQMARKSQEEECRALRSEAECLVHLRPVPVRGLMHMSVSDSLNERKMRKDSQQWKKKGAVTTDLTQGVKERGILYEGNAERVWSSQRGKMRFQKKTEIISSVTSAFLPSPTILKIVPRISFLNQASDSCYCSALKPLVTIQYLKFKFLHTA